ncbi:MAG TPA: hypothetical protein VHZ04_02845 [Candidatus Paceibacterota bacterium]|jgi:hypothetical protein|nr:hypothetical protein [Candidatus Paceibacterota bacterium]
MYEIIKKAGKYFFKVQNRLTPHLYHWAEKSARENGRKTAPLLEYGKIYRQVTHTCLVTQSVIHWLSGPNFAPFKEAALTEPGDPMARIVKAKQFADQALNRLKAVDPSSFFRERGEILTEALRRFGESSIVREIREDLPESWEAAQGASMIEHPIAG